MHTRFGQELVIAMAKRSTCHVWNAAGPDVCGQKQCSSTQVHCRFALPFKLPQRLSHCAKDGSGPPAVVSEMGCRCFD